MNQRLIKTWWLLALCGVFDAMYAVVNFFHAESGIHHRGTVVRMGMLALAAGACTIAAGIWSLRNSKSWFLVLNGFVREDLAFSLVAITTSAQQARLRPPECQSPSPRASYVNFPLVVDHVAANAVVDLESAFATHHVIIYGC